MLPLFHSRHKTCQVFELFFCFVRNIKKRTFFTFLQCTPRYVETRKTSVRCFKNLCTTFLSICVRILCFAKHAKRNQCWASLKPFRQYSRLFNKRRGQNKRGGGAKFAKSLNVEVGINVEGGIFWKKLVHKSNKRGVEGGKI